MRKIPATLATQHPDNARAPYWEKDGDGFVSTYEEVEECFSAFCDLGCQEYMWDWEGKHVEESVVERLWEKHYSYFRKNPLGKEKFLTFRIPNIWQEKGHSLARAMMCILTAEDVSRQMGMHSPPLFEVILPMTKKAEEILAIQKMFSKLSHFTSTLFNHNCTLPRINVMPLFEGIDDMMNCRDILDQYLTLYRRTFKETPSYLRLHIARSDPALNSGMVPAVVAGKIALSEFYRFGRAHGIKVFPAIGVGTLPFRGSLSPYRIPEFLEQYGGIKTVYIQSAFRYDFPLPKVKSAIRTLNQKLPRTKTTMFASLKDRKDAQRIGEIFGTPYRRTVEALAPLINRLAKEVPPRRERKQHIGLFGYSRGIGSKRLPRAIPFTAVFYSLGVPPEFIGTGFGLSAAAREGIKVEKFYPNLKSDLIEAGRFLNKENLEALAKKDRAWRNIKEDVALVEEYLGIKLGPRFPSDFEHKRITLRLLRKFKSRVPLQKDIMLSGKLRGSLG